MNPKEEIATILRDNIYYSPQIQGVVIHGAIEKIQEREQAAYFRGFRQGGIILILTIMLFLIYKAVNRRPAFTVPTPEQQMEDTLQFSQPIQEDSFSTH